MKPLKPATWLSALLCIAPQTGCTALPGERQTAEASTETRVAFRCDNGESIRVRFLHEAGVAVLLRHDQEIELAQQPAASGFVYSNGPNTLRGKGDAVTLEIGRMMPIHCTMG